MTKETPQRPAGSKHSRFVHTKKKKVTTKQLARRIRRLEVEPELRYIDKFSTSNWDSATVVHVTGIGQGDDYNQRVGEEILIKYIDVSIRWTTTTTTATGTAARFILFWNTQTNGVIPQPFTAAFGTPNVLVNDNALLDNMVVNSSGNPDIYPYNYRAREMYHVLCDKIIHANPYNPSVGVTGHFTKRIHGNNARIKYADSGNGVASVVSRSLMYFVYTSTTSDFIPEVNVRVFYTDP